METYPNYALFNIYLGDAYLLKKNYTKALTTLQDAKSLTFNNQILKSECYMKMAEAYNALQRYQDADEHILMAIKTDENNLKAVNNYSYYLAMRKEKLDEATKMMEKIMEKQPNNTHFLDTYGWVMYAKGNYKKAKQIFEKILEKNKDNGTYVEHYGDVLYKLGELNLALEQWQKAKKIGGTTPLIDKKIAEKKLYE
jgi:tetratricopeptide (TPR) repeat protein